MTEDALEETARRRLRALRQARGWTQDDLAERAHVGASTVSRIETGQRILAVDQLVTLARALSSRSSASRRGLSGTPSGT
jgi:transcriptional regulator with XRE-family HTH domain